MKHLLLISLSIALLNRLIAQQQHGTLSGEVRDAVTQQALPGTNIRIIGTVLGASNDDDGYFVITRIPPGTYTVEASLIGYERRSTTDVVVVPNQNTSLHFDLAVSAVELRTVDVPSEMFQERADNVSSIRTLSPEEIRRSPGSAEDIFRVMQSLPGVATAGGKSAQLIVRGGSPNENLTLLDNIEIYNPIHFARSGESMGIISIVNPALLEKVDFLTGGFPSRYGDKMSSVFDMTLLDGNREMLNYDLNTNIAGFGVMADGPIADNTTMIFSLRRGFFDILTKLMDRPAAPRYYDAVGKFTYDIDHANRISLVGFYYIDKIDREGSTRESSSVNKYDVLARDDDGSAIGINWRSLLSDRSYLRSTLSYTSNGWSTEQGTLTQRSLRGEEIIEEELMLKSELTYQISFAGDVMIGVVGKSIGSKNISRTPQDTTRTGTIIPAAVIQYEPGRTEKFAAYVQTSYRIFSPVTVSFGLRYDRFTMIGEETVSPRVSFSYHLTDQTAVNVSRGAFVQTPASYQISADPANLLLRSSKAIHTIIGLEHLMKDDTRMTIEAYDKELNDVIVGSDSNGVLVNSGSGYAQGIEAAIQKKFSGGVVGSLSYSYSTSRRRDHAGATLYDAEFDRTHILNVIAGIEMGEGWQIGAKFQYASGNPYTPVVGTVKKNGIFYLLDGPVNSARYPDHHALDIRVDRQYIFHGWSLTVYVDLWNVYNRDNIMSYSFKPDAAGTVVRTPRYDFGITPIAGVTAKF